MSSNNHIFQNSSSSQSYYLNQSIDQGRYTASNPISGSSVRTGNNEIKSKVIESISYSEYLKRKNNNLATQERITSTGANVRYIKSSDLKSGISIPQTQNISSNSLSSTSNLTPNYNLTPTKDAFYKDNYRPVYYQSYTPNTHNRSYVVHTEKYSVNNYKNNNDSVLENSTINNISNIHLPPETDKFPFHKTQNQVLNKSETVDLNELYAKEKKEYQDKVEKLTEELKSQKNKLEQNENEICDLRAKNSQFEKDTKNYISHNNNLKSELDSLKKQAGNFKEHSLNTQLNEQKEKNEHLIKESEILAFENKQKQEEINYLQKIIKESQENQESGSHKLTESYEKVVNEMAALKEKFGAQKHELELIQNENELKKKIILDKENEVERLSKINSDLSQDWKESSLKYKELSTSYNQLQQKSQEQELKEKDLLEKINNLTTSEKDFKEKTAQIDELTQQNNKLTEELEELKEILVQYEQKELQEYENRNTINDNKINFNQSENKEDDLKENELDYYVGKIDNLKNTKFELTMRLMFALSEVERLQVERGFRG